MVKRDILILRRAAVGLSSPELTQNTGCPAALAEKAASVRSKDQRKIAPLVYSADALIMHWFFSQHKSTERSAH
jgi:hypothetical protein